MVRQPRTLFLLLLAASSVCLGQDSGRSCNSWRVLPAASAGTGSESLNAIAVTPTGTVVSAGSAQSGGKNLAMIQRWDGAAWKLDYLGGEGVLQGIAALSDTEIWAVGGSPKPIVLRYDGATWNSVPLPGVPSNASLSKVRVLAGNDVWVVGTYFTPGGPIPIVLRWNGATWTNLGNPQVFGAFLLDIAVLSPTNVWVVGGLDTQTLIQRYDGSSWTTYPAPSPSLTKNQLNTVAVISPTDIWAGGYSVSGTRQVSFTVHWDGLEWTEAKSVDPSKTTNSVVALSVGSPQNVWLMLSAVSSTPSDTALAAQLKSGRWVSSKTADTGSVYGSGLRSIAATKSGDVWAAGYVQTSTSTTGSLVQLYSTCGLPPQ